MDQIFLTGHIYRRELHAVFGTVHEIVIAARKKAKFLKLKKNTAPPRSPSSPVLSS